MPLDLERMLHKCRSHQWSVSDLDFSVPVKPMSREREESIVQYFTDMAGIERLAGALFAEQRRKVDNPTLKKIFSTFVADEERHAQVAQHLADHYNVNRFRRYRQSTSLKKFRPHFLAAIRGFSPEIANVYITVGELLLDIALLRSLDDYVDDEMSKQAMVLINQDESRHIAIDFYMIEYYCSGKGDAVAVASSKRLKQRLGSWYDFLAMLYYAKPFAVDVFMNPMDVTDPSGRRMLEAFKRAQLISRKTEVAKRPFTRYFRLLQWVFNHEHLGRPLGGVAARMAGLDPRVMRRLYNDREEERVQSMSLAELAQEALAIKKTGV